MVRMLRVPDMLCTRNLRGSRTCDIHGGEVRVGEDPQLGRVLGVSALGGALPDALPAHGSLHVYAQRRASHRRRKRARAETSETSRGVKCDMYLNTALGGSRAERPGCAPCVLYKYEYERGKDHSG